eukprot:6516908-Prymnesium_polylepis.1
MLSSPRLSVRWAPSCRVPKSERREDTEPSDGSACQQPPARGVSTDGGQLVPLRSPPPWRRGVLTGWRTAGPACAARAWRSVRSDGSDAVREA